jgi:hypothetical protein
VLTATTFAVGNVTVLEPPDSRRTRLLGEASTPLPLSETLLLRRFAACDLESSSICGCNSENNIFYHQVLH